eukprot:c24611_g1_i8 orf=1076-1363(-)
MLTKYKMNARPLLLFKEISRMEMLRRESSWCCNCKHGLSISFERIHKLLNLDAKNSTKDYSPANVCSTNKIQWPKWRQFKSPKKEQVKKSLMKTV